PGAPLSNVVKPAMPVLPASHGSRSGAVIRTSNGGRGGWAIVGPVTGAFSWVPFRSARGEQHRTCRAVYTAPPNRQSMPCDPPARDRPRHPVRNSLGAFLGDSLLWAVARTCCTGRRMAASSTATALHPLHRLWRLFPAQERRRLLARATSVLAPRPDAVPPPALGGLAVAGELSRASGLGEVARLMLRGLARLDVPSWALDVGTAVSGAAPAPPPPRGAPLLLHVNAPFLPLALLRMSRAALRGR